MSRVQTFNSKVLLRNSKIVVDAFTDFATLTAIKAWYAPRLLPDIPDNTSITRPVDFTGNGTVLSQATAASQPKYRTNIINGFPAYEFDGTNDFFTFVDLTMTKDLSGVTSYVVYKRIAGTGASQTLIQFNNNAAAARHAIAINTGAGFNEIFAAARRVTETAATASFTHQDTQFHVIGNVTNYASDLVSLWFDGQLKSSAIIGGTSGANSQNADSSLGDNVAHPTNIFNGYIAEVIFCRAAHTDTMVKNVMSSLSRMYGGLPA